MLFVELKHIIFYYFALFDWSRNTSSRAISPIIICYEIIEMYLGLYVVSNV